MAGSKQLLFVGISLLFSCMHRSIYCTEESNKEPSSNLPGHMQPLGSHMEPEFVRKLDHMISPHEFYEDYVVPKRPVIFEGLLSKTDVLKNWQSDDYLRSHFSDTTMNIEHGKKENRSEFGFPATMSEFIGRYKDENIYMVSDMSPEMREEWQIPKFLLCGGFTEQLMFVFIWFSSGGTKSVVHTDSYENLHCLVSGQKKFVLIESHYSELIGPEHAATGFYNIDVEKVNMTAYPNLATVPWYEATVNPGDCLYLPYLWLHNVNSIGRNLGVNVWWNTFKQFQAEDCPPDMNEVPDFVSLGEFGLTPELQLKEALQMVARKDGTVHAEELYHMFEEHIKTDGLGVEHIEKLLDIVQPGCNGVVPDISKISKENLKKGFIYITSLSEKMMNENYEEEAERAFENGMPSDFSDLFDGFGEEDADYGWEGPTGDHEGDYMTEGGGDYEDGRDHKKDEL